MKQKQWPLYAVFALFGLALIYNIANPKAPQPPGPIGEFPNWKSINARGDLLCQATNPAGTAWAGAWTDAAADDKGLESAVTVIHFDSSPAARCLLDKDVSARYLSWADDSTLRAVCVRAARDAELVYIDSVTGDKKKTTPLHTTLGRVLCWPAGCDKLAVVLEQDKKTIKMAVLTDTGKTVGKEVTVALPEGADIADGSGLSADGSSFVFTLSDPAAKDGRSFYLANTAAGAAKRIFDLGDVPGRIVGIWPSAAGILLVCKVGEEMESLVYDAAAGKLAPAKDVVLDKWPGAPDKIDFTTYDGGMEFNLAAGKTKTIFDTSKKDSDDDKEWRNILRDSRFYRVAGGYITVSETGGAVDIRRLKSDGSESGALLSRF